MPSGLKLNSTTLKYNGLEEPEAWLDDYLTTVKFQRETNVTTMQYVQLMLESSTRHWLKNLWRGSITSWSQIRRDFIDPGGHHSRNCGHASKEPGRPYEHTSSGGPVGERSRIQNFRAYITRTGSPTVAAEEELVKRHG